MLVVLCYLLEIWKRYGPESHDKKVDMYILSCNEKWVVPRLDVSSVRRLDMFGLLPLTETVFAVLL